MPLFMSEPMAEKSEIANTIANSSPKAIVVEHLDPELEEWSSLEYAAIADECNEAGVLFYVSSIPRDFRLPDQLKKHPAVRVENGNAEDIFVNEKDRICLLDPSADKKLSPQDGDKFNIFLFGGILGDDPPRDRTSILRQRGFAGRNLGSMQMTTDTAARVTLMISTQKINLEDIPFIDRPDIKVSEHESSEMPFRYVKGSDDQPVMPKGMVELIRKDSDKQIIDAIDIL